MVATEGCFATTDGTATTCRRLPSSRLAQAYLKSPKQMIAARGNSVGRRLVPSGCVSPRFATILAGWYLAACLAFPAPTAAQPLPRGQFYSETGGDSPRPDDGFLVADRPGFGFTSGRNFVRFWSEFQRHGGVPILGYPASRPFEWDGFDVQVFQKSILQWRPDAGARGEAWSMNVFDEFTRRGLDQRLLAEKQVPLPGRFDDQGKSFEQIMQERLALLNGHPALARQFRSVPDSLMLYGLPNSSVQDFGPFYAVRLQRAAFQEWKIDAPGIARIGEVTVVNAGDVAKEFGLIPDWARQPVAPPVPASSQIALFEPGSAESLASPFRVAGDARAFEATVLWELTDAQSGTSSAVALRPPRRAVSGRASNSKCRTRWRLGGARRSPCGAPRAEMSTSALARSASRWS